MPFYGRCGRRQSWRICYFIVDFSRMMAIGFKETEREWTERAKRFVKAELKRADVTYEELAGRLREMGLEETKVSIASKLSCICAGSHLREGHAHTPGNFVEVW